MEFISVKRDIKKDLVSSEKVFVKSKKKTLDLGDIKLSSIKNAVCLEKFVNLIKLGL